MVLSFATVYLHFLASCSHSQIWDIHSFFHVIRLDYYISIDNVGTYIPTLLWSLWKIIEKREEHPAVITPVLPIIPLNLDYTVHRWFRIRFIEANEYLPVATYTDR